MQMRLQATAALGLVWLMNVACGRTPVRPPENTPSPAPIATSTAAPTPTWTPTPTAPIPTPTFAPVVSELPSDLATLPEGQLVFYKKVDDNYEILILKPDHTVTQLTRSSPNGYNTSPVLSPDGKRIAFNSINARFESSIHLINVDGTGEVSLVENASSPVWSADGKQLFCLCGKSDKGLGRGLARMNTDGSETVTLMPYYDTMVDLSVSPDGKRLLATTDLGSGFKQNISLYNLVDGKRTLLVQLAQDAAWSPDEKKIAYAGPDPKRTNFDIYVANRDGTGRIRLTTDPHNDMYPIWSPSGKYIAFLSYRDDPAEIYMMKADGTQQVRLTAGGGGPPNWGGPAPEP